MRITNKIIQNNSITHINNNKVNEDKLNTMMATGKKIDRPSDDPVVAIRALKLRASLSEVEQYCTKNVPDAKSWLSVTENALLSASDIVTSIYENYTSGSAGYKSPEDKSAIVENLKGLRNEIYSVGNADLAGRFVFSGFRTETALTFLDGDKDMDCNYQIHETFGEDSIEKITHIMSPDYTNASPETTVKTEELRRIRLSYDQLVGTYATEPKLYYYDQTKYDPSYEYKADDPTTFVDPRREEIEMEIFSISGKSQADIDAKYSDIINNDTGKALFIPETGEVILRKTMADNLTRCLKQDQADTENPVYAYIDYEKENWKAGDLHPEHYFSCVKTDLQTGKKEYFGYGLSEDTVTKEMYADTNLPNFKTYDYEISVGAGQAIKINVNANEAFSLDVKRDLDDIISIMERTIRVEEERNNMKGKVAAATDPVDIDKYTKQYDALDKEYTYLNDSLQKMFEHGITNSQKYLNTINNALTVVGNNSSRLDLVESRLTEQTATFKTLASENEDADFTEVAVQLGSAEMSYQAALMATGKISKSSLMDYI